MRGMGNQSEFRTIVATLTKFSLPLIFSGILQQLYSWADAFIVGNVEGETALAAIGSTSTAVNFYLTAITGFTLGLSVLFAQKFGSRQTGAIPQILSTFTALFAGLFTVLAGVGILLASPLLRLLNTTPDTMELARQYLQVVFLGVPFLAVYNVYSAALRGVGDSRAPFWSVLISSLVNIVLDILFVAAFSWGVAGAAVATVLSQVVMTVFIIGYSNKRHELVRFSPRSVSANALRQGARFGLPPMIQSSVSSFGSLILQNFMNSFGTQTVAAITTAYRVDSIVMLPIINLGSGISTIVAQNYGAGDNRRAKHTFYVGAGLMTAVSLILTALVIPFGGVVIGLFGVGQTAIAIGQEFFRGIASFYLVFGLATAVRGYLEGLGDMFYSGLAGILSLVVRIVFSYLFRGPFGNMAIAYAEAVCWGVLLVLYLGRLAYKTHARKAAKH